MSFDPPRKADSTADADSPFAQLLGMLGQGDLEDLDDIPEPTAEELAALEATDDATDDLVEAIAIAPIPALTLLEDPEPPELLRLETLDDVVEDEDLDSLDDVDDLLDEDDLLDFDDEDEDDLDEDFDLDDDKLSYSDLYDDDDTVMPSFREGEYAEEEDGDTAFFNDMR